MHPPGPTCGQLEDPCRKQGPQCGRLEGYLPRGRGFGPCEPLLWPTNPPYAEENVGHLLSTLATGLRLGTPWINTFNGDATPGKREVSFKQWYHEVQCVKDHYMESVVQENNVKSL